MATETTSTLTGVMKTYYSRKLLDRAKLELVHRQFGQPDLIPKRSGKVHEWRRYTPLGAATTPLTEGTTPSGSNLTVTAVTATLAQYGDFVRMSDQIELTAIDPILEVTVDLQGQQAGETLDTLTRNAINAGTTVQYASTATDRDEVTAAMVLNSTVVKKAVRQLKRNKAMRFPDGYFRAIVHPDAVYDLQGDADWKAVNQYQGGGEAIYKGEIGRIHGVRFIESNNAKVFTGEGLSSADVYSTLFFGANSFGVVNLEGIPLVEFIAMAKGSAGTSDPLEQVSTAGWKASDVTKILNESWIVRVEHGATV